MIKITPFKFKFIMASQPSPESPLLILVHGRTGNLKLLEWYAKRFEIPELSYLLIEAPYADQRPDQKDPGFSWYLETPEELRGIEESRLGFLKMIDELNAQKFSPKNIYFLGFSQGSAMSLDLALRAAFQMGGFICVSGFCIETSAYPKAFGPFAHQQKILIT